MWAHILTADTPNSLRGSISEAIQDYSRAIEINPLELNAYCSRGAAFVQQCEQLFRLEWIYRLTSLLRA